MKARNFVIVMFIVLACVTLVSAWDPIFDLALDVLEDLVNWAVSGILDSFKALVTALIEAYKNVLLWNPDPAETKPISDDIIRMLVPVYVVAIMITGFYWLFLSISPRSRAQAKGMLLKLLLSMPLVMASTALFQLMLDISSLCVNFIFSLLNPNFSISMFSVLIIGAVAAITAGTGGVLTTVFIVVLLLLIVSIFVVSVVRYLALLFMAAIFPLTIFLYLFDLTKDTGSILLRYTLMFAFMPVLQAFFIVFTITALQNGVDYSNISSLGGAATALAAVLAQFGIIAGGFIMIIVSPFIMLDLMEWLGLSMVGWVFGNQGALSHRGWNQFGHVTMLTGALLAGEGAGALPLAGTLMFLDRLSPHAPDQHHQISEAGRRYWDQQYGAGGGSSGGGGGGGGPKSGRKKFGPKKGPEPNIVEANTTQDHLKNAREYAKAGKYDEALKSYKEALTDKTEVSGYEQGKTDTLGTKDKRAAAAELADLSEAFAKRAAKATNPAERRSDLDKAMEANRRADAFVGTSTPESQKAKLAKNYSDIAAGYNQSGNLEQAAYAYKRAVDLDPGKSEYALKYADVLFKKG